MKKLVVIQFFTFWLYIQLSKSKMMSKDFTHLNADSIQVTEKDTIKFVLDRFSQVKKSKRIRDLVEFQAMNKYMLMSPSVSFLYNCFLDFFDASSLFLISCGL